MAIVRHEDSQTHPSTLLERTELAKALVESTLTKLSRIRVRVKARGSCNAAVVLNSAKFEYEDE